MNNNELLSSDIEQKVSQLFKVISDPTRIKIIYILKDTELSVGHISYKINMSQSAVSHQLKLLREHKFVSFEKKGKEVYYRLKDNHIYTILMQAVEHAMEEN